VKQPGLREANFQEEFREQLLGNSKASLNKNGPAKRETALILET